MPGIASPYRTLIPRPEKVFGGRLLRSIALLDEGVIEKMRLITHSGNVFAFPDVANESLPKEGALNWGLAHKIKDFAAGRKIISLVGYLQQTKGVEEFVALAKHPSMRNTIFFLGGEPGMDGFDEAKKSRLQAAWEQAPNLWAHLQRLPEESLNAVVASSDVVFAAYRKFPNSSNIMTKSAVFEKPIVVSDGFLMAERVRHYCFGEVVPEGDIEALACAVDKMLQPGYAQQLRSGARWADYKKDHSAASLEQVMKKLIQASV
jgi:glycosyltransferase involved in cell wall biosynthesis